MSPDSEQIKDALLAQILADVDDPALTSSAESITDPLALAHLLKPYVQEKFTFLTQGVENLAKINEDFFTGRKSFEQQFGLAMFPFFTFFDSMIERFNMDITKTLSSGHMSSFLGIFAHKEVEKQVSLAHGRFQKAMEEQLVGMEHEGAGPFVSLLSGLFQAVNAVPLVCENAQKEMSSFLFSVRDAHRQLFLSEGEGWEDAAMTAMGDVLGRLALTAMPMEKGFIHPLKKISFSNLKKQMEKIISTQRKKFQDTLVDSARPIYMQTVQGITNSWNEYKKLYEQRYQNFSNFLNTYSS